MAIVVGDTHGAPIRFDHAQMRMRSDRLDMVDAIGCHRDREWQLALIAFAKRMTLQKLFRCALPIRSIPALSGGAALLVLR